ncbi:MAG: tetratricopeptide repeat protein [Planctomycetota bacterium]|nr:tetratricopeptide repeat protein [Planctomycetota bacterium]
MGKDSDPTSCNLSVARGQAIAVRTGNALVTRGLLDIVQQGNRVRAKELVELGEVSGLDKRIEYFTQAIKLDPTLSEYLHRGSRIRSEADVESDTNFDNDKPTLANAYYCRAQEEPNHDRAIADLSEAIRLDPEFQVAYNQRGMRYYKTGDFDRAIADFTVDCRLGPHDKIGHYIRLRPLVEMGSYDLAIADLKESIRLFGDYQKLGSAITFQDVYFGRGKSYYDKGKYDQAIADYSEAIRLYSEECEGGLYCEGGLFRVDPYCELGMCLGALYYHRGNACLKKGDHAAAELDFAKAKSFEYEP